jgi:hypothetical protein
MTRDYDLVVYFCRWRVAAEGLQQQVQLIPRLERKVRELDTTLENAHTMIAQLEERLQAESSARSVVWPIFI